MLKRIASYALAIAFIAPLGAAAQTPLGSLTGTVRDSQNAVLPGATVQLRNAATGAQQMTTTNDIGVFNFAQLPAGTYQVEVSLSGFRSRTYSNVAVTVGQEYSLSVQLAVGQLTESIDVTAGTQLVATTTPEVTATVTQQQILDIPLLGRDVTNLIKLQAGVPGIVNRALTAINGGRPTWTQVTLDGINIQDNFIRANALDFLPNRPTSDSISEFTITTSVAGADTAGGASVIRMVTPSGSNQFRGSVFEFNRDAKFASNTYFNKRATPPVPKPELSRNQFGGRAGGAIVRDKLFFFGHYEGFRQETGSEQNITIPANADFINGVFRYVATSDGTVRSVNVLQLSGLTADPIVRGLISQLPDASKVNNFERGNSTAARLLNTAAFRFNQQNLNNRDQFTGRIDYSVSQNHKIEGVYSHFLETNDRNDLDVISQGRPLVYTEGPRKRFAAALRSTFTNNLQNEIRGGTNQTAVDFITNWDFSGGVLYGTALGINNPVVAFQNQGRSSDVYQLNDTLSWVKGRHSLLMGGSWQRQRITPYNFAGQYPTVTFGFSGAAPLSVQLTDASFPGGISATDRNSANAMAAWLGGIVSSVRQTYQVRDATSGYVPGIPSIERYNLDNIALFAQDNWRWTPNLTIRGGLKWEYYSPLSEANNLGFLPILDGRPINDVMLDPTARITFTDGGMYKKDLNNFGPTAGFAWDVTGDGRTAVRGGYSLTFVNEETINVASGASRGNAGLSTTIDLLNQYAKVSGALPLPTIPTFLPVRTLADQTAASATQVFWGIDPDLHAPHIHEMSIGIQREITRGMAVEARYVGTRGRDIWRGIDLNQMRITDAFLADFNRARSNGFLAQAATGSFNPAFNSAIAGSQPLTILPTFAVPLTNINVTNALQTNAIGLLVDAYLQLGTAANTAAARAAFMPNPAIYAIDVVGNGGFTDYDALQVELRRQVGGSLFAQVNYTLSHTKTDSGGVNQNRFEAFMDNNNRQLGVGRSLYHQTHVVNGQAIYQLPFGEGRRWLNRPGWLNGLVGDWQIASILALQSGSPLTIYSGRGTVNRGGRSNCGSIQICNTAFTTKSVEEIRDLLGVHRLEDGRIFWIDPSVIDPATGRGVGVDNATNAPTFAGQIFFNPVAGTPGNLPVLAFDGPPQFRLDLAVSKRVRFDRYGLEFKAEAFNLTNGVSFFRSDMDINSQTFGRLTETNVDPRLWQFSARLDF